MNTVNQLITFVKKKNSYFSDFLQQIINVYKNNNMNYIVYSNALKIMKNSIFLKNFFEEGITIKYSEKCLFFKDFSLYTNINELKYEVAEKFKGKFNLENLRYNYIFFFFTNDYLGKIYVNYPEDFEKIKNEKKGVLQLFFTKEYEAIKNTKINLDYSTNALLKEAIDYSDQIKTEIIFDKRNNKEKLLDENELIESNYLYENMENIGSNKSIEQEQFAVLGILSKIIQEKGIETAIYRDSSSSFNDSVIQMMCCDFSNKYDFIFDLGEEENKKILEDKNEYENFSATLKKLWLKN